MTDQHGFCLHATSLVIAGQGIIISGPSGSGKTSLALLLIERAHGAGRVAKLVSDDQTLLNNRGNHLSASPPATIAGAVEIRGAGLFAIDYQPEATVMLSIELVPFDQAPRYPEPQTTLLCGVNIPTLKLPSLAADCDPLQSARAIEATLFMRRWGSAIASD